MTRTDATTLLAYRVAKKNKKYVVIQPDFTKTHLPYENYYICSSFTDATSLSCTLNKKLFNFLAEMPDRFFEQFACDKVEIAKMQSQLDMYVNYLFPSNN